MKQMILTTLNNLLKSAERRYDNLEDLLHAIQEVVQFTNGLDMFKGVKYSRGNDLVDMGVGSVLGKDSGYPGASRIPI